MQRIIRLHSINPYLTCTLCTGYLIDASTLVECLHSFCKSCLVRYLESSYNCPKCGTEIHKTKPWEHIRSDPCLQEIVYKLVPDLFAKEEVRKQSWKKEEIPDKPSPSVIRDELLDDSRILVTLKYFRGTSRMERIKTEKVLQMFPTRYLCCSLDMPVRVLKKFVCLKFDISSDLFNVEMWRGDETLVDQLTLKQLVQIYGLYRERKPLDLHFSLFPKFDSKREKGESVPPKKAHPQLKSEDKNIASRAAFSVDNPAAAEPMELGDVKEGEGTELATEMVKQKSPEGLDNKSNVGHRQSSDMECSTNTPGQVFTKSSKTTTTSADAASDFNGRSPKKGKTTLSSRGEGLDMIGEERIADGSDVKVTAADIETDSIISTTTPSPAKSFKRESLSQSSSDVDSPRKNLPQLDLPADIDIRHASESLDNAFLDLLDPDALARPHDSAFNVNLLIGNEMKNMSDSMKKDILHLFDSDSQDKSSASECDSPLKRDTRPAYSQGIPLNLLEEKQSILHQLDIYNSSQGMQKNLPKSSQQMQANQPNSSQRMESNQLNTVVTEQLGKSDAPKVDENVKDIPPFPDAVVSETIDARATVVARRASAEAALSGPGNIADDASVPETSDKVICREIDLSENAVNRSSADGPVTLPENLPTFHDTVPETSVTPVFHSVNISESNLSSGNDKDVLARPTEIPILCNSVSETINTSVFHNVNISESNHISSGNDKDVLARPADIPIFCNTVSETINTPVFHNVNISESDLTNGNDKAIFPRPSDIPILCNTVSESINTPVFHNVNISENNLTSGNDKDIFSRPSDIPILCNTVSETISIPVFHNVNISESNLTSGSDKDILVRPTDIPILCNSVSETINTPVFHNVNISESNLTSGNDKDILTRTADIPIFCNIASETIDTPVFHNVNISESNLTSGNDKDIFARPSDIPIFGNTVPVTIGTPVLSNNISESGKSNETVIITSVTVSEIPDISDISDILGTDISETIDTVSNGTSDIFGETPDMLFETTDMTGIDQVDDNDMLLHTGDVGASVCIGDNGSNLLGNHLMAPSDYEIAENIMASLAGYTLPSQSMSPTVEYTIPIPQGNSEPMDES